jgi:hypothetical protein
VRIHRSKSGTFGDRDDPSVRGPTFESLPVRTSKDRSGAAFTDREIDRAPGARDEWDEGGLVSFPENVQGAVSAFEGEVFDVGRAGFADA